MITGIHHVAIIASHERSIVFYKQLGFNEIFRKVRSNDTVVLMEGFGFQLEIFVDPNHPKKADGPEPYGLRHLALHVDNLAKTLKQFKWIDGVGPIMSDWVGTNYCFIEDPNGLKIELHE